MDAQANPVRRRGREAHSSDFPTQQLPDVDVSLNKALDRSVIVDAQDIGADKQLQNEYLEALAFNEDPITISLEPTQEKNPPKWIECWVQGKGAEVLTADGWQAWGYLPMGSLITTKRKYVEVLLGLEGDEGFARSTTTRTSTAPATGCARSRHRMFTSPSTRTRAPRAVNGCAASRPARSKQCRSSSVAAGQTPAFRRQPKVL
jgi:hypothetical protein